MIAGGVKMSYLEVMDLIKVILYAMMSLQNVFSSIHFRMGNVLITYFPFSVIFKKFILQTLVLQ